MRKLIRLLPNDRCVLTFRDESQKVTASVGITARRNVKIVVDVEPSEEVHAVVPSTLF